MDFAKSPIIEATGILFISAKLLAPDAKLIAVSDEPLLRYVRDDNKVADSLALIPILCAMANVLACNLIVTFSVEPNCSAKSFPAVAASSNTNDNRVD